jgi:hypothetical protein
MPRLVVELPADVDAHDEAHHREVLHRDQPTKDGWRNEVVDLPRPKHQAGVARADDQPAQQVFILALFSGESSVQCRSISPLVGERSVEVTEEPNPVGRLEEDVTKSDANSGRLPSRPIHAHASSARSNSCGEGVTVSTIALHHGRCLSEPHARATRKRLTAAWRHTR